MLQLLAENLIFACLSVHAAALKQSLNAATGIQKDVELRQV